MTIRELKLQDLQHGLRDFIAALGALSPVDLTLPKAVDIFIRRADCGIRTYVALSDARVIGTASLFLEPKFIHNGGIVGHIEDVAVHADEQRRGVGAALVRHLIEVCRAEGCYKVILDCSDDVIGFYEKLGFRKWETAMRLDIPKETPE